MDNNIDLEAIKTYQNIQKNIKRDPATNFDNKYNCKNRQGQYDSDKTQRLLYSIQ